MRQAHTELSETGWKAMEKVKRSENKSTGETKREQT